MEYWLEPGPGRERLRRISEEEERINQEQEEEVIRSVISKESNDIKDNGVNETR